MNLRNNFNFNLVKIFENNFMPTFTRNRGPFLILWISALLIYICFTDILGFRFAIILTLRELFLPLLQKLRKNGQMTTILNIGIKLIFIVSVLLSFFVFAYFFYQYYDYDWYMSMLEVFVLEPIAVLLVPSQDIVEHITYTLRDTFDDYSHYLDKKSPRQHYKIVIVDQVQELMKLKELELQIQVGLFSGIQSIITCLKYSILEYIISGQEDRYVTLQVPIGVISEQQLSVILQHILFYLFLFFAGILYNKLSILIKNLEEKIRLRRDGFVTAATGPV